MKIKCYLLTGVLLLVCCNIFAMSPKIESFAIYNYSSNEVVINVEFWEGESEAAYNYMWIQNVCGINLMIKDFLSVVHNNILKPKNDTLDVIQYFPSVLLSETAAAYSQMDNTPFMEKMRAIFKKLEIVCNGGERVITLENLEDQIIKKWGEVGDGEVSYVLEIFDYDLEGKPASEW